MRTRSLAFSLHASCVVAVAAVAALLAGGAASAQEYPSRPIRIYTAPAGGSSDFAARILAQGMGESLRQPIVVDNRAGPIAQEAVFRAPADGYHVLLSSESVWIRGLMEKVPYEIVRDFAPIGQIARAPYVVAVHPSLPVKSVKDLIGLAKAHPGALNYGTAAIGSGTHLAGALFVSLAGVNIVQVGYKGVPQSLSALMAGEVQLMFANPSMVAPHVKTGKLRALGVTTREPTVLAPGLPPVAAAVPGYEAVSLQGLHAPGKTPSAIVGRLHQEMMRVLELPGVKEKFLSGGWQTAPSSPEQFAAFIRDDIARWSKVIKAAGIKAQ